MMQTQHAQIIEELEERLSSVRQVESGHFEHAIRKYQLQCEILARNELNAKLSEINSFLEERAREQMENDQNRDKASDIFFQFILHDSHIGFLIFRSWIASSKILDIDFSSPRLNSALSKSR